MELPEHKGPLPSLSQLATENVGPEHGMLQPQHVSAPRPKPRAAPEETRARTLNAMESAMPMLDAESAALVARARALLERPPGEGGSVALMQAAAASSQRRPGASRSAAPGRVGGGPGARRQLPPRRPASSAGGGGAAAAALLRAVPTTAPEYGSGGGGAGRGLLSEAERQEEAIEAARERVR